MKLRTTLHAAVAVSIVLSFGLLSCVRKHKDPGIVYMPNMAYSPAIKAQEPWVDENGNERETLFQPVAGTVPRGYKSYAYKGDPERAAAELKNPLPRTRDVFKKGQGLYNVYCIVCHGKGGEGDGSVVPQFPRPPTLSGDKVRGYSDGKIFHIITEGQNLMPSYASQVEPEERWAIVHYVRALHRAKNPSASDIEKAKQF